MTHDMGIRVIANADDIKITTSDGQEMGGVYEIDLIIRKDDVIRAKLGVFVSELDIQCVGEITTVKVMETGKRYRVVEEAT